MDRAFVAVKSALSLHFDDSGAHRFNKASSSVIRLAATFVAGFYFVRLPIR
jgi:hypothetical protein